MSESFAASDQRFPYPDKERIEQVLKVVPDAAYSPTPPVADRAFWKGMFSAKTIRSAECIAREEITVISDENYLEYNRAGTRKHFTNLRQ